MPVRLRPLQSGIEAGGSFTAIEAGDPAAAIVGSGTARSTSCPPVPCPLSLVDDHVCGCLNPPTPDSDQGLVSVISTDAAVRRSLVLLLEAEGLTARAFCSVPSFLGVIDRVPGPRRQCVLMEEEQARRIDAEWLAGRVAHESGPVSIVVLTSAPSCRRSLASQPLDGVAFVDPFHMDEVLTTIRGALAPAAQLGKHG